MRGIASFICHGAGAYFGLRGGFVAGIYHGNADNGGGDTLWNQGDFTDFRRDVSPSMSADSRRNYAARLVSGKLLLVSPVWKRDGSAFQKQEAAIFSSGNLVAVDSFGNDNRMCA